MRSNRPRVTLLAACQRARAPRRVLAQLCAAEISTFEKSEILGEVYDVSPPVADYLVTTGSPYLRCVNAANLWSRRSGIGGLDRHNETNARANRKGGA